MANISPYCEYIIDLLSPYGNITAKSMFGGYGIYKDNVIFAIIADDELYFKVDHTNQSQYEHYRSEAFSYQSKGKLAKMSYWKVPLEIMENDELLPVWLEQSYDISRKIKRKGIPLASPRIFRKSTQHLVILMFLSLLSAYC